MILVSGAGGKTGQAVIDALVAAGQSVRAWVRSARETAAHDTFIGDMLSADAWTAAMDGITKLYHICPNMFADEIIVGRHAIRSAQRVGCRHFVYHSVLHPQTEKMPHHWHKLRVEEMLFESGLPFTIMQPTAYMQNIDLPAVIESGVLMRPYPVTTRLSLIDLHDVGEAAAIVLQDDRFVGATLELAGTMPLSQTEVAAEIGAVVGRTITAHTLPLPEWERANAHLPDYVRNTLIAMFEYYAAYGFVSNPFVLECVLGRPSTPLTIYIERQISITSR